MNIKTLSFKELFGDNNIYEQESEYGGVLGQAEMIYGFFPHQFICFRKENNLEVAAIFLTDVRNKREKQTANKILEYIGTNLRFGKKINKIINNNNIEEIYNIPLFSIGNDYANMCIYNYLISPELLIALGIDRESNILVHLEIINDKEIISEMIDTKNKMVESKKWKNPMLNRNIKIPSSFEKIFEYEKAIEDYTKAIQGNPKDKDFYLKRAKAYYAIGEIEKAMLDEAEAKNKK